MYPAKSLPAARKGAFNARMKIKSLLNLVAVVTLVLGSTVIAQTTQMTGKILALTSSTITVQKGSDVWDISLTSGTKVNGTAKVGSVVTITYNTPDAQKKEAPQVLPSPSAADK